MSDDLFPEEALDTQPEAPEKQSDDVALSHVGVVVIGRNEGERLKKCLESVAEHAGAVVYVDSGSTDGSASVAKSLGVHVLNLDLSIPFTAARARNEGFAKLQAILPDVKYVQMIDGDCEVVKGWLEAAVKALDVNEKIGVVCGRRRERYPSASIYNGMTDMEWDTPSGIVRSCGGDAMFRVPALKEAGGYNASVIAGEEPELCVRLRAQEWQVHRIEEEMALHDAAMHSFFQWWKRNVRAGHAYAQGAAMHGAPPEYHNVKAVKSIAVWGIAIPLLILLIVLVSFLWSYAAWGVVVLCLGYAVLIFKVRRHRMKHGDGPKESTIYAFFTVLGKLPNAMGAVKYWKNHALGKQAKIIEYKSSEGSAA